jgi:hypothetical protein
VLLDPFVAAHGVNENENTAMNMVAMILTSLADRLDVAISAAHHTPKGAHDAGDTSKSRGASAVVAAARLNFTVTPMSVEEADRFKIDPELRRGYIRFDKGNGTNLLPPARYAKWFQLESINIGNGTDTRPDDNMQVIVPWEPPVMVIEPEVARKIFLTFDAGMADGQPSSGRRMACQTTQTVRRAPSQRRMPILGLARAPASTSWSSAPARKLGFRFRHMPTCCAMPRASRWPTPAATPARSRHTSATRTFATR